MNFLLRNSITQQQQQQQPQPQQQQEQQLDPPTLLSLGDADKEGEFQGSFTAFASGVLEEQPIPADDAKTSGSQEMARLRTRMPIEGHSDVSSNEGSVLIPCKELPEDWASAPDSAHLSYLNREFVFPGEQVNILVSISSHDLSVPEIITPFKVAAVINKNSLLRANPSTIEESTPVGEERDTPGNGLIDANAGLAARESLREEGHKKRSAQLLESFRNSHFYVRITGNDEQQLNAVNKTDESAGDSVLPVLMEQDGFDPLVAGGIARRAITSCALGNGDIVVTLQVTVAAQTTMDDAVLEVLQYEQHKSPMSAPQNLPKDSDPAQDLLHWLLPLDRNSVTPQPPPIPPAASIVSTSTQRLSFGSSNSTLFSFGHLRSSSQSSLPQVTPSVPPSAVPSYPPSALSIAPEEWDRLYPEKEITFQEVGSEGFLSFRGVPLEPQRFSAHCGLEGLYIPGKRWRRKISIVQPLAIESYFAGCNTEDLICVLIENVLPAHIPGVIIYVDSISIICQSAGPGSSPSPVPIACVEAGEDQGLPNLPLRTGEQHSFILRPTNSLWKANGSNQNPSASRQGKEAPLHTESGHYAVLVSCHCSHTQSRFYVKHSLKWQPRPPRDLLVSVSLENSMPTVVPNEALPQLKSQVVTVQATNLTSKDLDLTLLAPSTLACTPVSVLSTPNVSKTRVGNSLSFQEGKVQASKETERKPALSAAARSLSMPPGRQAEKERSPPSPPKKFRGRKASAAEIIAENSPARTHLWLQSTVPLGHVPAHSTTLVKCDLLPLTDGIITLDTLHLATKDRETVFIPENQLQIHSNSGIASMSGDQ